MKSKLRQIYFDMRHQTVIAWVTFLATAMSVALIMVVVMMQRVQVVPFAPESCRDHLLVGPTLHLQEIENPEYNSSSFLSFSTARFLYDDLDGVDRISYFTFSPDISEVHAPEGDFVKALSRRTDAAFFDVFDHQLVEGRYYTKDEADALMPLAILAESTARSVLGEKPWTGRKVVVDNSDYTVVGVVRDNSSLATTAHGEVFIPTGPADTKGQWGDYMGPFAAAMVVADGVDFQHIRDQVKGRYSKLDAQLSATGQRAVYHEQPYDQEALTSDFGSNTTPDPGPARRMRLIIYAILLIVPAINLSSMLHSRMRRRVNEIGVRRAFGCTRARIMTDIISENFIVTLAGGIVGVAIGVVFAATYSGLYETVDNLGKNDTPALSALLNWSTIAVALIVCFILNILSASLPAWQASRMKPVDALNSK